MSARPKIQERIRNGQKKDASSSDDEVAVFVMVVMAWPTLDFMTSFWLLGFRNAFRRRRWTDEVRGKNSGEVEDDVSE